MILNVVSGGNEDYYSIIIHTNSNAEVVVENEYETFVKTSDRRGAAAFCVTEGYWTITTTKDGESKTIYIYVVEDSNFDMTIDYVPKIEYNGDYEVINEDSSNWNIKFKTSGTLKFTELNNAFDGIEVFLCGGGGRGGAGYGFSGGGGGGGGYTTTKEIEVLDNTDYTITIGGSGGNTSAFGLSAAHGNNGGNSSGDSASGGSGTGAGGRGGSGYVGRGGDGQDGVTAFNTGNGTKYGAGGGGGTGARLDASTEAGVGYGYGGKTGGGNGASNVSWGGGNGAANTGGGGGGSGSNAGANPGSGGSGIVIIRNKRS